MTLAELKRKVLVMIEEIDENEASLTSDPDIDKKMNSVINQVMYELARIKKIPDYVEIEVAKGDLIRFEDITSESGYDVYQLDSVRGIKYEAKARGTILKAMEDGILEIEYFRYPELINEKTKDTHELELSADALEVLPYGVAGDLLKSDVSTEYGAVYSKRFEEMLQRLDTRYSIGSFRFEGGVEI